MPKPTASGSRVSRPTSGHSDAAPTVGTSSDAPTSISTAARCRATSCDARSSDLSRRSLPGFEEAFEFELAVRHAAVEQPVAPEHAVLVGRAGDVRVGTAGAAGHEADAFQAVLQSRARQDGR